MIARRAASRFQKGASNMRYELNDYEWRLIKPMLPQQAAWRTAGGCGRLREKSCPWVSFSWSMETVGEPCGFCPKLLKWKHFVPSVPKSLGQQALRKIRSLEHFAAVCPPTRSTAASLKHRRCWAFPARHLVLRIVAIEEIGGEEGIRTHGTQQVRRDIGARTCRMWR